MATVTKIEVKTLADIRNAFTDGVLQTEKRYCDDELGICWTGARLFDVAFNSSYDEDSLEGVTFIEL